MVDLRARLHKVRGFGGKGSGLTLLYRSVFLAIGVRIGLLAAAYVVGMSILDPKTSFWSLMREVLQRWDANNYVRIAEVGYQAAGHDRLFLVYFPLYPMLLRGAEFVVQDYVVAGLIISFVASVAAGYYLQALAHLEADDDEEAHRALWYFFLFPTAYFLIVPYTEALFVALVLASFYAARKGVWHWSAVMAALACATRMQGLLLLPALALEALHSEGKSFVFRAWPLALAPLGFLGYLYINWEVGGDPFAFVDIQRDHWQQKAGLPWNSLVDTVRGIRDNPNSAYRLMSIDTRLAAVVFSAIVLAIGVRWLRPSYQIFAWGSLIFFLSATWSISMPRYVLTLFPLYLVLARVGSRPAWHQIVLASFIGLLGGFFAIYVTGRWAF